MATAQNLMAYGMAPALARALGRTPAAIACAGSSVGDAGKITIDSKVAYCIASNGGSGLALASVGGDAGFLLGDLVSVTNLVGANVTLYAANGSFVGNGATSVDGATGIAVSTGQTVLLEPISVSTWAFVRSSV